MSERRELQRMLFGVTALADLGQEVTSGRDHRRVMRAALHAVCGMLLVPRAALYAYDDRTQALSFLAGKGFAFPAAPELTVTPAQAQVLPQNTPLRTTAPRAASFAHANAAALMRLDARTLLPLFAREVFVGIMTLSPPLSAPAVRSNDRELLKVAAHQCAAALHNARLFKRHAEEAARNRRLYEDMRRIYHDTIQAFATAIDAKDRYTKFHSFRVAHYAAVLAREMQWSDGDVEAIYVAGLLHDVGKLSLDVDLINKESGLTPQEQDRIRRHTLVSYDIVKKIRLPWEEVPQFIRHHHERLDGTGYPDRVGAGNLCDGARILALADSYDAMTSDRPYRQRLTPRQALDEIRRCEGTQFDGRISSVFSQLVESGRVGHPALPLAMLRTDSIVLPPFTPDIPGRTDA